MEIVGKIIQILEANSGTSAKGEWKRQDFIIETQDQYPKKVCISNWNNKVELDAMGIGSDVKISINIESREFNGKWYTDIRAWKMELANHTGAKNQSTADSNFPSEVPPPSEETLGEDDLPF
ncbi:MAG: DUF3127 domain-containing protein [Salinivirgaceae bacterium]|nr:DUF3127 domain-containing protein [Salinivirgaceae bacterium]